ncbi:MAG: ABC transporter ATP-binding protein/permease [Bacteroidaceae bacterium]|nr:ABC transporter ATP-binding protein/permease [Bacteroidaceae bacterium]
MKTKEKQKYRLTVVLRWIWQASKGARGMVVVNSLVGTLDVAVGLAFVWFSKEIIDIATGVREGSLVTYGIVMAALMLAEIGVRALDSWIANTLSVRNRNRLRYRLFARLMQSEWRGLEQHHSGDVLNRLINDITTVSSLITETASALIITVVQLIASFFFLYYMDRTLALIIVCIMPLFLVFSRFYVRRMRGMTKDVRESDSRIHAVMQESLQNKLVIKTLEQDSKLLGKLDGLQDTLEEQVLRRTRFSIGSRAVVSAGFAMGYLTAFLWGVFRIAAGSITFGVMTAFLQLVGRVQRPITDIARMIPGMVGAVTSGERLMELEELPLEQTTSPQMVDGTAGVRLEDVTFHYAEGDRDILKHFSADFPPHTATAILGETGAGKTTLIRLLLALVKPVEGRVVVYDEPAEKGESHEYAASPDTRCNFVYVPQGNTLFSGTIRDNLLLGDSASSDERMWAALDMACADFVRRLPQGLDTPCGEGGGGLSEGQAQRIAIARSLLRPGSILLLDESTSALDVETERELLRRITEGEQGKTLIFITHRPSVTGYCDRIIRIEN